MLQRISPTLLRRPRETAASITAPVGRLLARIAYYVLIVPAGAVVRLVADPLNVKSKPAETNWQPLAHEEDSIERARRLS